MLQEETILFLIFVLYGFFISITYDVFRALRKFKKSTKNSIVTLQDVIYIILIFSGLVVLIYKYINEEIRVYLIFSSILGIIIYYGILGNKVRNIFVYIFNVSGKVISFIFLPLKIYIDIYDKLLKNILHYVKMCCKRKINMIHLFCNKINSNILQYTKERKKIGKESIKKAKK